MLCGDPYFCLMVKSPILRGKPDLSRWLPFTLPRGSVKASLPELGQREEGQWSTQEVLIENREGCHV